MGKRRTSCPCGMAGQPEPVIHEAWCQMYRCGVGHLAPDVLQALGAIATDLAQRTWTICPTCDGAGGILQ